MNSFSLEGEGSTVATTVADVPESGCSATTTGEVVVAGNEKSSRGPVQGLRVAIVTPYSPPLVGGIASYVDGLARGLMKRGLHVRIWTRYGQPSSLVERGPENSLRFVQWARRRLRAWRPDVIHAHSHWYALASAFDLRGPIAASTVFSVHTDFDVGISRTKAFVLSLLMRKADVVTAVSPGSVERLRSVFPRIRRLELVPPGTRVLPVDDEAVSRIRDAFGLARSFPKLSAVGIMVWPEKVRGMKVLIESMPHILTKYPSAKLLLVGDGPERSKLQDAVRVNNLHGSVLFAGSQPNPAPFVVAADIMLHCSFQESFAQVVLEALSLGRPVIANHEVAANFSRNPTELGIMACAPTPTAVAKTVCELASNPVLRAELADRGRAAIATRFNWDAAVNRFLQIYGLS